MFKAKLIPVDENWQHSSYWTFSDWCQNKVKAASDLFEVYQQNHYAAEMRHGKNNQKKKKQWLWLCRCWMANIKNIYVIDIYKAWTTETQNKK